MRNPGGQAVLVGPTEPGPHAPFAQKECDTFTCGHCQRIMEVPVRADPADIGGLCKQCMAMICPACVDKQTCTPWEKTMERMESREAALRSYGM